MPYWMALVECVEKGKRLLHRLLVSCMCDSGAASHHGHEISVVKKIASYIKKTIPAVQDIVCVHSIRCIC